jgi:hypothetical protein
MTVAVMDASAQAAVDMPMRPANIVETVSFLRRFASMISVGQNAAHLNHAALLIEALLRRTVEAERAVAQHTAANAAYADMCKAYEIVIDRQRADMATQEAKFARLSEDAAADRVQLAAEALRLTELVERARAERAIAAENLADVTTRFASLGETCVIVQVAALEAMRAQFDSLADEFVRHGDVVALAMSDAGRCAVDQLLADGQPDRIEKALPSVVTRAAAI